MRGRLGTNVIANVTTAVAGLAAAAISTPLIIGELGKAAFGIWTLVASFLLFLGIAETGFGPAVQRFVAISRGQGDRRTAMRLMWTVVLAYAVIGGLACVLVQLLASEIVNAFDFPSPLEDDAEGLLRVVGVAVPVSLVATGLTHVLAGLERFVITAVSAAVGALVLLGGIVVAVAADTGLEGVGAALLAQHATFLLLRAAALRDVATIGWPAFATRDELRAMLGFSARLQVSALSLLINSQSDKVVVGLVSPATTVAQLGVGAQVAEAGRLVGGAMLPPIISRLTVVVGSGDHERVAVEYRRLSALWIVAVAGATAVGIGVLHPLLLGWLGDGFGEASLLGAALVLAYGINVATGIGVAYLRAIGSIGLESRAGVYTVLLNAALTIPLALAAEARGVVLGTLGANIFGTAWFFWRLHRTAPFLPAEPWPIVARCAGLAVLAGTVTFGVGLLAATSLPRYVSLIPVACIATGAFALYLSSALQVSIRPRAWRDLVSPSPADAGDG